MRHRHPVRQPDHRAHGGLLILLLILLLGSVCTARGEEVLQGVCNPDFPPAVVEAHEPTDDAYFADAVFVGDSMMEYVELLGEIPTAEYVWKIGIGPATMGMKQFRIRGQDGYLSAYEMVARSNPRKIFIMLGANGLDWYPSAAVIADYEVMADTLITLCPEAMIYVISAPPGSAEMMEQLGIVPGRYAEFNVQLKALAERRGFYYLDFYSLLADEKGTLPRSYDSGDGFHLNTVAYQKLVDLVRRHTVPYPESK